VTPKFIAVLILPRKKIKCFRKVAHFSKNDHSFFSERNRGAFGKQDIDKSQCLGRVNAEASLVFVLILSLTISAPFWPVKASVAIGR